MADPKKTPVGKPDNDEVKPDPADAGTDSDSLPDNDEGHEAGEGDSGSPEKKESSVVGGIIDGVKNGIKTVYENHKDKTKKETEAKKKFQQTLTCARKLLDENSEIKSEKDITEKGKKLRTTLKTELSDKGIEDSTIDEVVNQIKEELKTAERGERLKEKNIAHEKAKTKAKEIMATKEYKELKTEADKIAHLKAKLEEEKIENLSEDDLKRVAQSAVEAEVKQADDIKRKAEAAKKRSESKPIITTERVLLASTLAVHTVGSVGGMVVDGTVAVAKGTGRLIREEIVGIAGSGVDLLKQAGKTVVYPFGRIGYGAKNRFMRGLDWATKWPTDHSDVVKQSHAPVHAEEPKAEGNAAPAAASGPSKPNILSRGISYVGGGLSSLAGGMWNLTKKAWYRTQQAVLITVAAPAGLVIGALEGAARAIPNDIIGVHWEGEPSVSETGAASRKTTDKKFHVDGGALGILLAGGKTVKDIVYDAPIRAFEEQLTTIRETPIEDKPAAKPAEKPHPKPEEAPKAEASGGGGHAKPEEKHPKPEEKPHDKEHEKPVEKPAEKIAETDSTGEHNGPDNDENHKKNSTLPVYTDSKKGFTARVKGIGNAIKAFSEYIKEDEPKQADFEKAIDAMDEAVGSEDGSVIGALMKSGRNILGRRDNIDIHYDELGKQMFKLKTKDRDAFFQSLNMVEFRKKFRVLIDASGTRFTDAMKSDKDSIKKQIATLLDHTGPLDRAELTTLIDALEDKLGIRATTFVPGTPRALLRAELDNIRVLLLNQIAGPTGAMIDNPRLNNLFTGEVSTTIDINYKALGAQIFTLKPADRTKFITSFDEAMFNSEFPLISSTQTDLNNLLDGDTDGSVKKAAKAEFVNLLKSDIKLSDTQVGSVVRILQNKIFAAIPAAPVGGVAPTKDRQVYDLLGNIVATLNQANIDKIFAPETAPTLNYAKFGEAINKIKTSRQRDAFLSNYDRQEFQDYFKAIRTGPAIDLNTKNNPKTIKENIDSLLGYSGQTEVSASEFRDRLDNFMTSIRSIPPALPATTKPSVFDDIEMLRDAMTPLATTTPDPSKLRAIYHPEKEVPKITVQYQNFGRQLMSLADEQTEVLGFIKAFDISAFSDKKNGQFRHLPTLLNDTDVQTVINNGRKADLEREIGQFLNGATDTSGLNLMITAMNAKLDLINLTNPHSKLNLQDRTNLTFLRNFLSTQATVAARKASDIF